MVAFNHHIRKVHFEDPILKKSELTQLDCLSHFILQAKLFSTRSTFSASQTSQKIE